MDQFRYWNLEKIDHKADDYCNHSRRTNDRVYYLFRVGLTGDSRIAIGPDQDIKDGVVAAGIQETFVSEQCLNQREAHVAGIGKNHREFENRPIILSHTSCGQHSDDETDHNQNKGMNKRQDDPVKNLCIKFRDIGIHDHAGYDDRYQQTGEVMSRFRCQYLRFDREISCHNQHKKDDDLAGRDECQFHESSLICTKKVADASIVDVHCTLRGTVRRRPSGVCLTDNQSAAFIR